MFRGAVFDLNGTLVDDIPFHVDAWRALGTRLGFELTTERFQAEINGLKNEDIFPKLLGRPVSRDDIERWGDEKEQLYRALYRPKLAPLRGAPALLERLKGAGIKLAVASSAPRANRNMVLDAFDWWHVFDVVVEAEGLRGKPAPDIFLAAAAMMKVEPETCVAFEDATNGVRAAVAAKMVVVGVTTNAGADELRDAGATFTVADFTALPAGLFDDDDRKPRRAH